MSVGLLVELSYDAAVRALDLQERGVEQLRARTGTLLAASSLTASFLGAQSIANQVKIDSLGRYYFCAALALMLQLVFWSWALAGNIS